MLSGVRGRALRTRVRRQETVCAHKQPACRTCCKHHHHQPSLTHHRRAHLVSHAHTPLHSAQLYAVCSAETSGGLELGATAKPMRRVRAGNILRYTVTIRSAAKQAKTKTKAAGPTLNLRVALPAGVHYVRSSTRPWLLMRSSWGGQREIEPVLTDNGALLTWEDIGATRKIKVKVHVGSNIAAGTPLTFSAQLYESVQVGSNVAPACAQSAPNVTVMVI